MSILKFLFILLEVLILFNILIFVHELGHFLAARWRGLKVLRFAIWFGKPIWKKKIGGIEYVLGTIPAGGYVSLPQMAPMEAIEGSPDDPEGEGGNENETEEEEEPLEPIGALDKIIVAFAGPLFSFGLAILFAVLVWQVGRPVSERETTTTIGYVQTNGPAARAGLLAGDVIQNIDNKPVKKFSGMGPSVTWRIVRSEDETIPITVLRDGQPITVQCTPVIRETKAWERKELRKIQIAPAFTALVGRVITNSPASHAGLQPFDEILSYNGTNLYHFQALNDYAMANPGEPIALKVKRGEDILSLSISSRTPISPPDEPAQLGILWDSGGKMTIARPGVWEQIYDSVDALVSTLGALFSSKSDISAQHLSGAVKILNIYYILFESPDGWRLALWFSVLLNVNLAILNMLPIPVLDGGHIVLAILESIRRKPVSIRLLAIVQNGCALLLIGYMLYITFFDVQDLPWGGRKKDPIELKFAPIPAETPVIKPSP